MSDIKQRQYELIEQITEAAEELGWIIAIPQDEESDELVQGLIMGTEEFITNIVSQAEIQTEVVEFDTSPGSVVKKLVH